LLFIKRENKMAFNFYNGPQKIDDIISQLDTNADTKIDLGDNQVNIDVSGSTALSVKVAAVEITGTLNVTSNVTSSGNLLLNGGDLSSTAATFNLLTSASTTTLNVGSTGGTFTFVEEGTNYADNAFVCTNDTTSLGAIGFGATQIAWSPFSGGASLTMGQGLSKSGNTIATNFNLAQSSAINANLSKGFSVGGTRSGPMRVDVS
jgi:hypothetical protein